MPTTAGRAWHRVGLVGAAAAMGIRLMLHSCIPGRILQGHGSSAAWAGQAGRYGQHPTRHSLRSGSPSPEIPHRQGMRKRESFPKTLIRQINSY